MSKRLSCWDFHGCGRGPGGSRVDLLGECRAATAFDLDGLNGGPAAGRICWAVAGSFSLDPRCCVAYWGECSACSFLHHVQDEEGRFAFRLLPPDDR